ncbi:MAG: hypothetical protein AB1752_07830 [Candidatus Zixiibacteriota bacterium]
MGGLWKSLAILGIVLAVVALYHLIDRIGLPERRARVVVREKFFREAHSTTTYSRVGNAMRPVITEHPDEWVLKVEMGGSVAEATVPQDIFNRLAPGDSVILIYTQRRLLRSIEASGIASEDTP